MEALKQENSNKVDLFSDSFIQTLYDIPWQERNVVFASLLKTLEVISVSDSHIVRIGKSDFQNPKGWVNQDNKPPYEEGYSFDDYMSLVPDFVDPYPNNVVEHDGILVVRDDLIPGNLGSKVRYAEALMQQVKEKYLFYAMVNSGQALKVLASVAKKYNKVVVAVSPNRKEPTLSHIEAMEHGAIMLYYQTGGMAGARKRCRAIIEEQLGGNGLYIPAGVKHPFITAGFAKSVNKIYNEFKPDVIFCAASTSVMAHGIMIGTPEECEVHAVQVAGNSSLKKWPGRATVYHHEQSFGERVNPKLAPPFNCIGTYDAKAWKYVVEYKKNNPDKKVMFWNVAGEANLEDVKKAV